MALFTGVGNNNTTKKKSRSVLSQQEKCSLWQSLDNDLRRVNPYITPSPSPSPSPTPHDNALGDGGGVCPECSGEVLAIEDGYPVCINPACAIIVKDILDFSPEWRFFGSDDKGGKDPTRCGKPINPLLVESSFGCRILCTPRSSYEMKKIRKWTEWQSIPHKEKTLYDEFQFITIMAQNAGIPRIFIDDAMNIHKKISEQKMFRGLNRDGMKSASIYMACRLNDAPRTSHEIANIFNLNKTSATNGCSMAVSIFHNIERGNEPGHKSDLATIKSTSFIERYCSKLNINRELTLLSLFICKKIEEKSIIFDNTPHSIAAGIIFFISQTCNLGLSKRQIKGVCGVSEVTINKCYKKIVDRSSKTQFVPQCILRKYSNHSDSATLG